MRHQKRGFILSRKAMIACLCALALVIAGCTVPIEHHGETVDVVGELSFDEVGVHLTFQQLRIGTQEAHPCGIHLNYDGTVVLDNPLMAEQIVIGPDGMDMEHFEYYGPCPSNAAVGNSGLTASFTREGTMCTLNWPRASYYDHLNYLTLTRQWPRMGAKLGAGSFAGIAYELDGEEETAFTWLRDEGWNIQQEYLTSDDNVLVTRYQNPALGLEVTGHDFVLPQSDVLTRRFTVEKDPGSAVDSARLIYYENFDPCLWKIPLLPVSDWLMDAFNDHACFYDSGDEALVHYRPSREHEEEAPAVDSSECGLPGVYLVTSADRPVHQFQCGFDARGLAESIPGEPWDSYYDAQDGVLSGSPSVSGYANASLSYDLGELEEGAPAQTTIYIAAAETCGEALELAGQCKAAGYEANLSRVRKWWRDWLSGAAMPDTSDEEILKVYKRSLIVLRMNYDTSTGAVVVSPARQPPFGEDWPRDGCYINYALDLAGYQDMAAEHMRFYERIQRPGGTWGMCYYSDGMEGGPLVLQSDTVGHIPWAMWEHYQATGDIDFLRSVYPEMRKTAWFAVLWKDPATGLPLPSFEDDSLTPVQEVVGATSLYMGLDATIKAAEVLHKDRLFRSFCWRMRADELKQALVDNFWDEEAQNFGGGFHGSWVIWPGDLFPGDDPFTLGHARHLRSMLESHMNMEGDGGGYEGCGILALASIYRDDPEVMDFLRQAVSWLAHEVATPGTGHFGEFFFMVDWDGDGRKEYVNHSAIPHAWNHALFVISALEVFGTAAD